LNLWLNNFFSLSGTERKILKKFEAIVEESLPLTKLVEGAANSRILSYVSFVNEEKKVKLVVKSHSNVQNTYTCKVLNTEIHHH